MTRPIRNTGPCFPSGLPRQRGQRDVLSHTEFYTPIFCMLSVFQTIPFKLPRKPPTVNRWDSTLGTPGGDKYYNQYHPQCEVCPRDEAKVVESEQGVPQGGVLSTKLFSIKINDIVKCLGNHTDCLLYVDDLCICIYIAQKHGDN